MSDEATVVQDDEDVKDERVPEPEREEDLPPPITASQPTATPAMAPPPVAPPPLAPNPSFRPPTSPINPDQPPPPPQATVPTGPNPNQAGAENPFHALLTREDTIKNPVARVAAKVGTHLLGGLNTAGEIISPKLRSFEQGNEERPLNDAYKAAQTRDVSSQADQREAQTARMKSGQLPIKNPVAIFSGNEQVGEEGYDENGQFHRNLFPTDDQPAGPQNPPERPAGPAPQVGGAAPVGGQLPPPRPLTTQKPQEPQRAPLATPEEQAKLQPVAADADTYNKQISDMLGKRAGDFPVRPTDSREQAEKTLADAKSEAEAERGKASEARGTASENRANQTEDLKPVQATDPKTGQTIITNFGDARKGNMENVLPVGSAEIQNARSTMTNVNLMEQALKSMKENLSDFDALSAADKRDLNQILNSSAVTQPGGALHYISGAVGGAVESMLQSSEYQQMSEPAKNILRNIANLRESSLGLGKLETGGSRAMQSAIDAINTTIPGRNITNAKDAETQLRMFADRLDEIKSDAPVIKGHAFRDNPFTPSAPEKEPTRPANVPKGYSWNPKGPKGPGWYK